ncbi:MAG: hypothetical protein K0Q72_1152 [Armatimonadetes bacterium]|jgi:hypothetical protein|nr:hypothetical protein [Armatimonadota bacterium]
MSATLPAPGATQKPAAMPTQFEAPKGRQDWIWVSLCLIAGVLFQLGVVSYFYSHFDPAISRLMPDDTFYYLKIAQNIRLGYGSAFSPGEPTNGYHPFWMVLLVIDQFLFRPGTREFVLHTLLLAVTCNGLAGFVFSRLLRRAGCSEPQALLGVGLYLFSPWTLNLTLTGLETPLYFLCLFSFFFAVLHLLEDQANTTRSFVLFGLASGCLMLARTDAIFFTGPAFALILYMKRLSVLPKLVISGALATLVLAPWLIWSYMKFGTIMQCSGTALSKYVHYLIKDYSLKEYLRFAFYNTACFTLHRLLAAVLIQPHEYSLPTDTQRAMMLGALAVVFGPIFYAAFIRRRLSKLPAVVWLVPVVLLCAYYFLVRMYVQVWHMAPLLAAAIFGLTHLARGKWLGKPQAAVMVAAIAVVGCWSLRSGYFYPQEHHSLLRNSIELGQDRPGRIVIGATDAGYQAYFSRHEVVNLDGVVNNRASQAITDGKFSDYIESRHFDGVSVVRDRLEFYDRNRPQGHAKNIHISD